MQQPTPLQNQPHHKRAVRAGVRVPEKHRLAGKLAAQKAADRQEIAKVTAELRAAGLLGDIETPNRVPQPLTLSDSEKAELDLELTNLEHLVAPYGAKTNGKTENIVRYLHSFESALALGEKSIHLANKLLTINHSRLQLARPYQLRLAKIEAELEARKREVFGTTGSIFQNHTITTYDREGNEERQQINEISYSKTTGIMVTFRGGRSEPLSSLYLRLQEPVQYGPQSSHGNDIENYINKCFGSHTKLIERTEKDGDEIIIFLKTHTGKAWSVRCVFKQAPGDALRTPALMIRNVSNWQRFTADQLLESYNNERLTKARIDGLVGYINMHEPVEDHKPLGLFGRLEKKLDSYWEKGARWFHGMVNKQNQ